MVYSLNKITQSNNFLKLSEKNSHFLKKYEINVDVKGTFSLYFFGGFCYKKKWTMKRGGLDGQSRATHNK